MDKETLKQYRGLLKEIKVQDRALDKLYDKRAGMPVMMDKVSASNQEFPYEPRHVSVEAYDPEIKESIDRRIEIKTDLRKRAERTATEIEEYIARIDDPTIRCIFELVYIEGKTHREAAEVTGYSRQAVTKILNNTLKE